MLRTSGRTFNEFPLQGSICFLLTLRNNVVMQQAFLELRRGSFYQPFRLSYCRALIPPILRFGCTHDLKDVLGYDFATSKKRSEVRAPYAIMGISTLVYSPSIIFGFGFFCTSFYRFLEQLWPYRQSFGYEGFT